MSATTSIPVLLAPGHLTKHLKVFLDKAAWRDKAKLITRYAQIIAADQSTTATTTTEAAGGQNTYSYKDGSDLTQYMALALLPVGPFSTQHTASPNNDIHSLWDLIQDLSLLPDLASIDWPAPLSDPTLHKTIFLTWLSPSAFSTPKHLLVQTPLEKLQQTASEFLLPYLQSWAISDLEHGQGHEQQGRLTPDILPDLLASLPQKWEHYSDFTFLPPTAFLTAPWPVVLKRLITLDQQQQQQQHVGCTDGGVNSGTAGIMVRWEKLVQDALGSTHIARKAIIPVQDILRRPKIRPLAGDWKLHNRYKSWIEAEEDDEEKGGSTGANLLEHQEMSSNLSSSKANAIANNNTPVIGAGAGAGVGAESTGLYESATSSNNDVLPTSENFSKTYWSETCQNQVFYCWSPMFTMFSAGNITEKERVANSRPLFDARNKVVVDLYAGIGYFALVYLIHAGARTVHACEWNPWSVEGLVRGAGRNGIPWKRYHGENVRIKKLKSGEDDCDGQGQGQGTMLAPQEQAFTTGHPTPRRPQPTHQTTTTTTTAATKKQKDYGQLVVYPGDNAQWIKYFENTAHHVNLGLIPTAEPGWVLGVRALCPLEGGYLHVHHNIRVGEEESFKSYLLQSLRDLFTTWKKSGKEEWSIEIRHMENVKSFAPLVFHYVVDVECRPPPAVTSP